MEEYLTKMSDLLRQNKYFLSIKVQKKGIFEKNKGSLAKTLTTYYPRRMGSFRQTD
jgi:argonaute-like protein implicated in RNA metabolism and viral defense